MNAWLMEPTCWNDAWPHSKVRVAGLEPCTKAYCRNLTRFPESRINRSSISDASLEAVSKASRFGTPVSGLLGCLGAGNEVKASELPL